MRRWYESEECNEGIIVGGQICLVRNIEGYPFEDKMSKEQQASLVGDISRAVSDLEEKLHLNFRFLTLSMLVDYEYNSLMGRLTLPPQMCVRNHEMGLILSEDESVSILINGREHLCIQVSCGGGHIQEAMKKANLVDDCLNEYMRYAFSKKYGYLTASPLYMGTGMSASYLLHLPYLTKKKQIPHLEKELSQYGFSLRGHFQGQIQAPGNIYRVKNRKTLGLSESEIISALEYLISRLVLQEKTVAGQVFQSGRSEEEDQMYRAYGLLKYARKLSYDETMECLSDIHIGDLYGVWQRESPVGTFAMMVDVDDSVLSSDAAANLGVIKRQYERAAYIQKHLPVIDPANAD